MKDSEIITKQNEVSSANNFSELLSHVRPDDEVNDEVGRGVDDHEDVGDVAKEDGPDREPAQDGHFNVKTKLDLLQSPDLVYVEQEPGTVADEEGQHDEDEDDAENGLLLLLPFPQLDDFFVDSYIEYGEGGERQDAEDDEF